MIIKIRKILLNIKLYQLFVFSFQNRVHARDPLQASGMDRQDFRSSREQPSPDHIGDTEQHLSCIDRIQRDTVPQVEGIDESDQTIGRLSVAAKAIIVNDFERLTGPTPNSCFYFIAADGRALTPEATIQVMSNYATVPATDFA